MRNLLACDEYRKKKHNHENRMLPLWRPRLLPRLHTLLRRNLAFRRLLRLHLGRSLRMHLPHHHPLPRLTTTIDTTHHQHTLLCRRRRLLLLLLHQQLLLMNQHRLIRKLLPTLLRRLSIGHHALCNIQPLLLLLLLCEPLLLQLKKLLLLLGSRLGTIGQHPRHPPIRAIKLLISINLRIMRHLRRRHPLSRLLLDGRLCPLLSLLLRLSMTLRVLSLGLRRRILHLLSLHLLLNLLLLQRCRPSNRLLALHLHLHLHLHCLLLLLLLLYLRLLMLLSIPYRRCNRPRVDSRRRSRQRRSSLSNIPVYRRPQLRRIVLRCKRNPMRHPLRRRCGSQSMLLLLLLTAQLLLLGNLRLQRHR